MDTNTHAIGTITIPSLSAIVTRLQSLKDEQRALSRLLRMARAAERARAAQEDREPFAADRMAVSHVAR